MLPLVLSRCVLCPGEEAEPLGLTPVYALAWTPSRLEGPGKFLEERHSLQSFLGWGIFLLHHLYALQRGVPVLDIKPLIDGVVGPETDNGASSTTFLCGMHRGSGAKAHVFFIKEELVAIVDANGPRKLTKELAEELRFPCERGT